MVIMKAKEQCKLQDITMGMGELNAYLGRRRVEHVVGLFALGEINKRRERWAE